MLRTSVLLASLTAILGCSDTFAPQASLQMLEVTGKLDVLDARAGWKSVRVSLQLHNPTTTSVTVELPDSCVMVRSYRDDSTSVNDIRGDGCTGLRVLQPQSFVRLRAEPVLAFGPAPHQTEREATWTVTAKVKGMRVNHGGSEDSAEVYVGTVSLVFR